MRHFWTTAAVAALCAISSPTWAAPQLQYLQLVASKHTTHASKTAKKKRATKASARKSSTRRARTAAQRRAQARREQQASSSNVRRGRAAVPSAIHTEAGASVKVRRGDTLSAVSDRTGVSMSELIRLNRLKRPYHLRAGATLKLPSRRYYSVRSGDTLYSLSRRFGVDEDQLRSLNGISRGRDLLAGQKLYLPAAAKDSEARAAPPPEPEPSRAPPRPARAAPEPAPEPRRTETAPPTARATPPQETRPAEAAPPGARPAAPVIVNPRPAAMPPPPGEPESGFELAPSRPPAATPVRPPSAADARALPQVGPAPNANDVVAAGRGRFLWPAAGTLLSGFGPKPDGQRNDGVNIAANTGDPVRAAADGEVVYAGDQVPSFGNLVLIKHDDGWVTAYAHMSRILVKNRDQVRQGQQIGVVGQSGSVDRPQLHFEIRYAPSPKDKATPIDPMLLLPPR
jgi:murein DD-endopeptidase MepM/ murein hydrolase activator NlpD